MFWRHHGAMSHTTENSGVRAMDRFNLRLSTETFGAIDDARAKRAGRVSRNTWIAEAIEEKLAREVVSLQEDAVRSAANA